MADAFRINGASGNPHFEAASQSRRMRGFNPARNHINRAIEASGETLIARSRWLYDNEGIYGSAVDEWVSAAVSDGIKPHPRIRGHKKAESACLCCSKSRRPEPYDLSCQIPRYSFMDQYLAAIFSAPPVSQMI